MAYSACLRFAFAIAVLALAAPSCNILGGACNCPETGPASSFVLIEAAESNPIVAVTAQPPCTAQAAGANGQTDPKDFVSVTSGSAGTCRVVAQLTNGDTYAFEVEFATVDLGCCGSGIEVKNFPDPRPTDAGISERG
jgi:hypothetical protein